MFGLSLLGNKHLLRCDDMWKKLLQHFDRRGCIANIQEFLRSRNRIMQRQGQQPAPDEPSRQQMPLSAREQQYRYPRQSATPADGRRGPPRYGHGDQHPHHGYQGPWSSGSRPRPKLD